MNYCPKCRGLTDYTGYNPGYTMCTCGAPSYAELEAKVKELKAKVKELKAEIKHLEEKLGEAQGNNEFYQPSPEAKVKELKQLLKKCLTCLVQYPDIFNKVRDALKEGE